MSSLFDKQTVLILVNFVIIVLYCYVLELNKMKFPLLLLLLLSKAFQKLSQKLLAVHKIKLN